MKQPAWGRDNNFNLIRLAAALQVAVVHTLESLGVAKWATLWMHPLPGVPIFFFVSGFLIYPSLQNSASLGEFARKRVLRIYPALYVFFVLTVGLGLWFQKFAPDALLSGEFLYWARCQLTFFQYENTGLFRYFGVGVPNGVVWTIAVELQFYALTPIIAWLVAGRRWAWPAMIVFFAGVNLAFRTIPKDADHLGPLIASFLPWIYMFLLGAWLSSERAFVQRLLRIPLVAFIALFFAVQQASIHAGFIHDGNGINPALFVCLALLVLKLAHTCPAASRHILGDDDISYGVYLSHMLVINTLIELGLTGESRWVALSIGLTICIGIVSWFSVERSALRLKSPRFVQMPHPKQQIL